MIPDIKELNFPSYATLSRATVSLNDMGERVITTQVKIDGGIKPDFSYNWEVEFKGEKYIHSLRSPQALKDNTSICSKIDLTFQHWVVYELKRHYFVELTSIKSGTAIPDKYIASLGLSVSDFVTAFQNVLDYYYKGAIKIQLNPDVEYSQDRAFMNISYSYIWEVLQEFYNVYGVRWYIKGDTIYVGYPVDNISHIFEYGYENGLISIERQVQDTNIRNILLGRGGFTNLPQYYFKNAPEGSLYASDPDAIPELEYVFFSELRDKTFRDYVQGWKTNPNRDTKGGTIAIEPYDAQRGETDFAYRRGHEDKTFDPIEYVKDDASISKYGELPGGLDNNDDIYPSIQNVTLEGIGRVNEVVAVEPVVSDNIDQAVDNEAVISTAPDIVKTATLAPQTASLIHLEHDFIVEKGLTGSLYFETALKANKIGQEIPVGEKQPTSPWWLEVREDISISIYNATTATHHDNGLNLPSGYYHMTVQCKVFNPYPHTSGVDAMVYGPVNATLAVNNIKLVQSRFTDTGEEWKPTFDIWVKNIWQTEKLDSETEQEYADRVWLPIFGDEGREAMVTFSSGWLSSSEGWEFMVVKGGYAYDTSKSYNGVPSHWRLTLQKSDAELKATDKYIPNMGMQAVAGDTFFFTGIDMQHQYVLFAEQRINEWKHDSLKETKDINPTWVAKLDKVRINKLENEETLLIDRIQAGALVNIRDKRFIDGVLTLYIQSVTYNYTDKLVADVDIVLSDKILPVLNPVQRLQGDIDSLSVKIANQSTALLNMVRQMCDALYLRKDGVEDLSKSPTAFKSIVKSDNFRSGMVGGAGWGVFRDSEGNAIAEFDQIRARQSFVTNEFIRNTTKYQGGTQIYSAAEIEISKVVENENDYECYFDQKDGSVANLFAVDDVAYSQLFNSQNYTVKIYKRRVIEVGVDFIRLSKTDQYGDGIPAEKDIVIHYGNYTDKNRQYIIIRDIIGGGYDRMISNLDSVSATGKEYYFAGREYGEDPRWFVGDAEGEYASWRDGKMSIKGDFIIANTGESVETKFEVTEEGIKASVEQTQAEAIKGKTLLYNASFTKGLDGWLTSNTDSIYFSGTSLLFASGSMLAQSVAVSNEPIYNNVFFVNIKHGWIKQSNLAFINKPEFDGTKEYPLFFSANIRCNKTGVLNVLLVNIEPEKATAFKGVCSRDYSVGDIFDVDLGNGTAWHLELAEEIPEGAPFIIVPHREDWAELYNLGNGTMVKLYDWWTVWYGNTETAQDSCHFICSKIYEPTIGFSSLDIENLSWNGQGDFYLSFSGDADFYGLTIFTDKTEVRHKTFFEQSDRLIAFGAQALNADGSIKQESGIVVQAEGAGLYARNEEGKQAKVATYADGVVTLEGKHIQLKGNVTANGNVRIDDEGKLHAKEGEFEGKVTAKEGKIAEFEISENGLTYEAGAYTASFTKKAFVLGGEIEYSGLVGRTKTFTVRGEDSINDVSPLITAERKLSADEQKFANVPIFRIQDNSNFPTVAIETTGAIHCNGGLIQRGALLKLTDAQSPNLITILKNTLWVISNNYQSNAFVYLPRLTRVQEHLNINNDEFFAIPVEVLFTPNSQYSSFIAIESESGESAYQYKIIDWNGSSNDYQKLSNGDSMRFLLIYDGETYYAQILSKTT